MSTQHEDQYTPTTTLTSQLLSWSVDVPREVDHPILRKRDQDHFCAYVVPASISTYLRQVETLYREEALNRKKIFNAMEDLKVHWLCRDTC